MKFSLTTDNRGVFKPCQTSMVELFNENNSSLLNFSSWRSFKNYVTQNYVSLTWQADTHIYVCIRELQYVNVQSFALRSF